MVVYGDCGVGKTSFVCRILNATLEETSEATSEETSDNVNNDNNVNNTNNGNNGNNGNKTDVWKLLNDRILAKHFCNINDDDSLNPILFIRSLALQLLTQIEKHPVVMVHEPKTKERRAKQRVVFGSLYVYNLVGVLQKDDWLTWLQEQESVRTILNVCIIPMLQMEGLEELFAMQCDTIVIDALDTALPKPGWKMQAQATNSSGAPIDTIVTLLMEYQHKLPQWLHFLFTSSRAYVSNGFFSNQTSLSMGVNDNNSTDVQNYVAKELQELSSKDIEMYIADELKRVETLICHNAKGNMMYAVEVLKQYKENPGGCILEALPLECTELYMDRYKRMFKEDYNLEQYRTHTKPMLSMLMCAHGPLPVEMVRDVGNIGGNKLWTAAHSKHLNFVKRFCIQSLVNIGLLQLSHLTFSNWLCTNTCKYKIEKEQGEKLLGDCCYLTCTHMEEVKGLNGMNNSNGLILSYSLKHVVVHLIAAGRKAMARDLLLNVKYLMTRVMAMDTTALLADYQRFYNDGVLPVVASALQNSLPTVQKDSRQMLHQLYGRLKAVVSTQAPEGSEGSEGPGGPPEGPEGPEGQDGTERVPIHNIKEEKEASNKVIPNVSSTLKEEKEEKEEKMQKTGNYVIVESERTHDRKTTDKNATTNNTIPGVVVTNVTEQQSETKKKYILKTEIEFFRNRLLEYVCDYEWWYPTSMCTLEQSGNLTQQRSAVHTVNHSTHLKNIDRNNPHRETHGDTQGDTHSDIVTSIALSSNGLYAISGSKDTTMRLWNIETGNCEQILQGHTSPVVFVKFSKNDQYIVSSETMEKSILNVSTDVDKVWLASTGECITDDEDDEIHESEFIKQLFESKGILDGNSKEMNITQLKEINQKRLALNIGLPSTVFFSFGDLQDQQAFKQIKQIEQANGQHANEHAKEVQAVDVMYKIHVNGTTGVVAVNNDVHLFSLNTFGKRKEYARRKHLGFDMINKWSEDKEKKLKEDNIKNLQLQKIIKEVERRKKLGFHKKNPWSKKKEADIMDRRAKYLSDFTSNDPNKKLLATTRLRKNLSVENPPIQQAIDNGVVPILITFLSTNVSPKFQFEAAWAVTNITSGTSQQVVVVVQAGAIPPLVHLLSSPNDDVREQAVWALGNIAGDSTDHRNKVLQAKAMDPLLVQLNCNTKLSVLRVGTWMLSNLCRGKPQPLFSLVSPSLTTLGKLLLQKDDEILTDTCWAISYLSDGSNEKIATVIDSGVTKHLVKLLMHNNLAVQTPALRAVGNISTGDELQTQIVIDCGALPCLLSMLSSVKKGTIKEACWTLSNITAGNSHQIQAVIDANIVPALINLLLKAEYDIKKEAAWAISNLTSGGKFEKKIKKISWKKSDDVCIYI